jgi:hypothetical protein
MDHLCDVIISQGIQEAGYLKDSKPSMDFCMVEKTHPKSMQYFINMNSYFH